MAISRPTTNNNINIHVPTYKKRSSVLLCWSACHFVWFNLLHALPIALPHCPAQSQPHHECQHRRTGRAGSPTSAWIDGQCGWYKRRRHVRGRHYFRLAKVFTTMAIHPRCVHTTTICSHFQPLRGARARRQRIGGHRAAADASVDGVRGASQFSNAYRQFAAPVQSTAHQCHVLPLQLRAGCQRTDALLFVSSFWINILLKHQNNYKYQNMKSVASQTDIAATADRHGSRCLRPDPCPTRCR